MNTKNKNTTQKPNLLRCTVTVENGVATASYRWAGLAMDGHCRHDEDVSTWTVQQIRDLFADLIGADLQVDRDRIVVEHV